MDLSMVTLVSVVTMQTESFQLYQQSVTRLVLATVLKFVEVHTE